MRYRYFSYVYLGLSLAGLPVLAAAHGPLFSFSPRTEFKDAYVYELTAERQEAAGVADNLFEASFRYGVTSNWDLGLRLPYRDPDAAGVNMGNPRSGFGDAALLTRYRLWRQARADVMRSFTVLGDVEFDSGAQGVGSGSTDALAALAYGYESLDWYYWASAGYRYRGKGDGGLQEGGTTLLNLVGGWRPRTPEYGEPDTVFLVELNGEITGRAERDGRDLANRGGTQVFVSPGMIWTYGQFNMRPGIQIPVYSDLNGNQAESDFRARLELEMHF